MTQVPVVQLAPGDIIGEREHYHMIEQVQRPLPHKSSIGPVDQIRMIE